MEPTTGIEPVNLILTKDVLYLLSYVGPGALNCSPEGRAANMNLMDIRLSVHTQHLCSGAITRAAILERETGFEPATLSLEG